MAFIEFERKRLEKIVGSFVELHRPPPHIRPELDLASRISGQSVEVIEVRPRWRGSPGETMERPVAKATFVKTRAVWRVYWQRADLKWHSYPEAAEVRSIEQFLALIAEDKHGCFFG